MQNGIWHWFFMQVLGNAKGALATLLSVIVFRNPVNTFTVAGYAITLVGTGWYSYVSA
jgi:hypothetical protein